MNMGRSYWLVVLVLSHVARFVTGLITLNDMNELTNVTRYCTSEIIATGMPQNLNMELVMRLRGGDDDDEVEDTVTAVLRYLDSKLLEMLNVPVDNMLVISESILSCSTVIDDYHLFLAATTIFLRAISEKQQTYMWRGGSPVFDQLTWLQALWASRKANEQQASFIEQQLKLYSSTGCFGKSNEVLRRDVEVVEFMNDLIDRFT